MKKISAVILMILMLVGFSACGGGSKTQSTSGSAQAATASDLTEQQLQQLIEEAQKNQTPQPQNGG